MVAHLGTNDLFEVKKKINAGDRQAEIIYNAMIYQIAKGIGAAAAVLDGRVDGIVLSGGLVYEEEFIHKIRSKIEWIAKIFVYPGEKEMIALAQGGLRILNKKEKVKEY
jgi:butyrate kinase